MEIPTFFSTNSVGRPETKEPRTGFQVGARELIPSNFADLFGSHSILAILVDEAGRAVEVPGASIPHRQGAVRRSQRRGGACRVTLVA